MTDRQEIVFRLAQLLIDARDIGIDLEDKKYLNAVLELVTTMNKISPPPEPIELPTDFERAFRINIEGIGLLPDTEEEEAG